MDEHDGQGHALSMFACEFERESTDMAVNLSSVVEFISSVCAVWVPDLRCRGGICYCSRTTPVLNINESIRQRFVRR